MANGLHLVDRRADRVDVKVPDPVHPAGLLAVEHPEPNRSVLPRPVVTQRLDRQARVLGGARHQPQVQQQPTGRARPGDAGGLPGGQTRVTGGQLDGGEHVPDRAAPVVVERHAGRAAGHRRGQRAGLEHVAALIHTGRQDDTSWITSRDPRGAGVADGTANTGDLVSNPRTGGRS